jgi:D-alanine-D-alanine ligase
MKVAVVYNDKPIVPDDVVNFYGVHTSEYYDPKTVSKVATALSKNGHEIRIINGNKNIINEVQSFFSDIEIPGLVFNMAYGIQGTSRYSHTPSILEMVGVPYVGSSPETHSICQNKILTKILLKNFGILTPKYWHFKSSSSNFNKVKFPVIVKPVTESSSSGIHIAKDHQELSKFLINVTHDFKQDALIEQFVPGREFTVSIIGNHPKVEILPIIEFDFGHDPMLIQTNKTKSKRLISKICPADIPLDLEQKIKKICLKIFEKLNLRDYCRIDLRLDSLGNLYVLEVNSMASFATGGSLEKSAKTAGYDFNNMINRIFDVAVLRCLNMPTPSGITQVANEQSNIHSELEPNTGNLSI